MTSPTVGSAGATGSGITPAIRLAVLAIEREDAAKRTAATAHALGIASLVAGDLPRAVTTLEEAATLSGAGPAPRPTPGPTPGRTAAVAAEAASIRSDLAAAYLSRDTPGDRIRALDEATHAIALDASAPEGWFNAAIASERTGLSRQAAEAWRRYLSLDTQSAWREEAARRLRALDMPPPADEVSIRERLLAAINTEARSRLETLVREWPDYARQIFERDLVSAWARAAIAGGTGTASGLTRPLPAVGAALTAVTGDRMASDIAARLVAIEKTPPAARDLARALVDFDRARELYLADRVSDAAPLFRQAAVKLAAHEHPFALWADYYLSVDSYYRGDLPGAQRVLRAVRQEAESRGFVALSAQCSWMLGLIDFTAGRFLDALEAYEEALDRCRRLNDQESVAALRNLRAEVLDALGESQLAWKEREEALGWLRAQGSPRRIHTLLRATARGARDHGWLHASLAFRREGLANAQRWNRDGAVLEALVGRAQVLSDLGQEEAASKDVDDAIARLDKIGDPVLKRRFAIDVYTAAGEVAARRGSARAATALSQAIAHLDWAQAEFALARLYLLRGRAQLAAGQSSAAMRDFLHGAEIAERQRRATSGERLRLLASARLWELYGELAQLELARGATDAALEMIERGRALSLLDDRPRGAPAAAFRLDDGALDGLLNEAAVLYYAFLPTRVVCWTLMAGRAHRMLEVKATPDQLRTVLRTHRRLVESGGDAAALDLVSGQLYDLIVRPLLDGIPAERQLLIVPDDELHGLAFAGLRDPATHRYLIDRHPIAIGSSLRVLTAAAAAGSQPPPVAAAARVLVVGSPQLADDRALPTLPDAAREAASIAALYPAARFVTGQDATRDRVLRQLENTDVFHYAGHAIANPKLPSLSRLLLAADRTQPETTASRSRAVDDRRGDTDTLSSALLASEVIPPSLGRLRIVILAACRTAEGTLYPGEGVASVARPFLVAGVPVVVAALWDVDDRGSRELFERFHRQLSAGATVAGALRHAQRSMARDADPRFTDSRVWAAFETFGVPWVRAIAPDR